MKAPLRAWLLVASLPLLLLALAWQGGRYAALEAEARAAERAQAAWVEANKKLVGSIAVLESRERAAFLARKLGLEPASPGRRLLVVVPGSGGGAAGEATAPAADGADGKSAGGDFGG
jgi:hypothetical protein